MLSQLQSSNSTWEGARCTDAWYTGEEPTEAGEQGTHKVSVERGLGQVGSFCSKCEGKWVKGLGWDVN